MMHWWYGPGWWGGWVMMIFMMLFWVALIVGLVVLIRWFVVRTPEAPPGGQGGPSAVEILRRRYARGEITREQFEQMLHDLEERAGQTG